MPGRELTIQRRRKRQIAKEVDQLWVRGAGSPRKGWKGH